MPNFKIQKHPDAQWLGGPPAMCHVCNFINEGTEGFLIVPGLKVLMYDQVEVDLHLCLEQHAAELKTTLDELLPDPTMPKLQGRLLSAEAARARAEKRADAAEAALHAMQDWMSSTDAK